MTHEEILESQLAMAKQAITAYELWAPEIKRQRDELRAENAALRTQLEAYEGDPEIADARSNHGLPFSVVAGKYDGDERNCKYCDDFATLDEAITAFDAVSDYTWAWIEYGQYQFSPYAPVTPSL